MFQAPPFPALLAVDMSLGVSGSVTPIYRESGCVYIVHNIVCDLVDTHLGLIHIWLSVSIKAPGSSLVVVLDHWYVAHISNIKIMLLIYNSNITGCMQCVNQSTMMLCTM